MIKLLSLVVLPALVCAPINGENGVEQVSKEHIQDYAIVSEWVLEGTEKAVPYAKNRDKKRENSDIRTLEEPIIQDGKIEKKPFANIDAMQKVSGEESPSMQNMLDEIDRQFEYMHELKAMLDEREKETSALWNRYYAIKQVYDKAMNKCVENWARENGIETTKGYHNGLWR